MIHHLMFLLCAKRVAHCSAVETICDHASICANDQCKPPHIATPPSTNPHNAVLPIHDCRRSLTAVDLQHWRSENAV